MFRLLPAVAVVLLFTSAIPALAQRRAPATSVRQAVEFRLGTAADASRLEILLPDAASSRSQRRSITDLMLRLSLPGDDVTEALRLPNRAAVDRDEGLMQAEVYLVSGGRLLREVAARCDRWIDDVAICKVGCEGGAFGLRRGSGQQPLALSLIIGQLPRGDEIDRRRGFALDPCQDMGGEDHQLAPAGGRELAEIRMRRP